MQSNNDLKYYNQEMWESSWKTKQISKQFIES